MWRWIAMSSPQLTFQAEVDCRQFSFAIFETDRDLVVTSDSLRKIYRNRIIWQTKLTRLSYLSQGIKFEIRKLIFYSDSFAEHQNRPITINNDFLYSDARRDDCKCAGEELSSQVTRRDCASGHDQHSVCGVRSLQRTWQTHQSQEKWEGKLTETSDSLSQRILIYKMSFKSFYVSQVTKKQVRPQNRTL